MAVMDLLDISWTTILATILIILIGYIWYKITTAHQYFSKNGIPYIKPSITFWYNLRAMAQLETPEKILDVVYAEMKDEKIVGFYELGNPVYVVKDPELIEKILIKDFTHFQDHMGKVDFETNPMEGHLFNLKGQHWRTLRVKLSPIFTSGKIKWMFDQVVKCGDNLVEYFDGLATGEDVAFKPALSSYGLDVIGSCAFGIETQELKHPDSKFVEMANKLFKPTFIQFLKFMARFIFPRAAKFFKIKSIPPDLSDFFLDLTKNSIKERIKNNSTRNDFMQLLTQLKQKGFVDYDDKREKDESYEMLISDTNHNDNKYEFTYEVLAAQAFIFFFAGFETTSTAIAYTLAFLSNNPDVQSKLRDEIKSVLKTYGGVTYDAIKNMTYLDCCVSETLRLVPPAQIMLRECTKDYKIDNFTIEKEQIVYIPISSLHLDENHFEEPLKYMPDRFIDSKYSTTKSCGVYLPFGDGPRVCIARRFGLLQVKVALIKIITNFELLPSTKEINLLDRNPAMMEIQPKAGLHVKVKKLNK